MRKNLHMTWLCLLALVMAAPSLAGDLTALKVFEQLKGLEGRWEGPMEGEGQEAKEEAEAAGPAIHEIQVSAAGTVVMETMGPGTEHEMINMYHLDGDDLLLTHYCAGGNQPRMRLDLDESTPELLIFEFVGGTNLDPDKDHYIGSARIEIVDSDHMESIWGGYSGKEQKSTMTFHLARTN